jgi:hypothetical protein
MASGIGRNGELFHALCDPGHLIRSALAAARGKRRRRPVAKFLLDLEPACFRLAEELLSGVWNPGPYRAFWIRDPKPRLISAAPFWDRVVHHALVSLMEPHFERRFVPFSYACRKTKGTHRALRRAHDLLLHHRFVLKSDIVKFFPSLDHEVVKDSVRRVIADERFLEILDCVIDGSNPQEDVVLHFPGDDLFTPMERRHGLPIGNLTSQFMANVVLDRLDHFVMDTCGFGRYVRYCDDFLVFGDDRCALWEVRGRIEEHLAGLRLKLHSRKGGLIGTPSPVPFLGWVLHGRRRRLQRRSVVRASKRMKRLAHLVSDRRLPCERLTESVRAWLAHAAHGHTKEVRKRVLRFAVVRMESH